MRAAISTAFPTGYLSECLHACLSGLNTAIKHFNLPIDSWNLGNSEY
jgi:hypothetical protein